MNITEQLATAKTETAALFLRRVTTEGAIPEDMTAYWRGVVDLALGHAEQWGDDCAQSLIEETAPDLSGEQIGEGFFVWRSSAESRYGLAYGDQEYLLQEIAKILGAEGRVTSALRAVIALDRTSWTQILQEATSGYLERLYLEAEEQQTEEAEEEDQEE